MPTLLRRIFSRKTFVRLAFAAAVAVTLLFAAIALENWRGEHAWANYRIAAEKRGERVQLGDFVAPPVPDAENFAAIPIIQDIFAASAAGKDVPNPFAWPAGWKEPKPAFANRHTGERLDLAKWHDAFIAAHLIAQPTDNAARDVLTGLGRYEPALQQLHVAAQRPHSRFPVKWERNIAAPIPHIALMQSAVRLEALKMNAHLALGDSAAAYADWRDGLGLYHALEHEPVLICGLVRVAILNTLVEAAVWDGLAGRQWAEPELRALAADLASLNLLADLQFAISSERGGMNDTVDWLRGVRARERWTIMNAVGGTRFSAGGAWLYPSGWYRESQVKMNELYDYRLAQIDAAQGRLIPGSASDEEMLGLMRAGMWTRLHYMLASLMMPALDGAEAKYALSHTTMQQARIACALELFRRAHETFPERLEELVPGILDAIPRDAMDGSPLHYRRTESSFELWGVGWNRIDDGGKSGPAKSPRDQLDWVWRS